MVLDENTNFDKHKERYAFGLMFMGKVPVLAVALILVMCSVCALAVNDHINEKNGTNLKYVALGDSITYGFVTRDIRMSHPYPSQLAHEMGINRHINLAVSGATVSDTAGSNNTIEQLKYVPADADLISVMIGVNDFGNDAPLGKSGDKTMRTVYGGLELLVSGLMERCPDAFIFFMTPFEYLSYPGPNGLGYTLKDVVDAVTEICSLHGVPILDMYTLGQFSYAHDPWSDGLHPSEAFFRKYTVPTILDFLERTYFK